MRAKWIVTLWATPDACMEGWHARLRKELAPALFSAGAAQVRLNLPDRSVEGGAALRQSRSGALPDAVLQLWLGDAPDVLAIETLLAGHAGRWTGWAVEERVVLDAPDRRPGGGRRSDGWAQIALFARPASLDYADWLEAWQGRHTAVAVETQSTFAYIQNRVLGPLTDDADPIAAIVEEGFPEAALTDPLAFFDAVDDRARFDTNLARMMDSCACFIAPGGIDVLPTAQYDFCPRSMIAKPI